jgi:beta-lactamase regulating signal transducer with metallopeptidase domain
MIAIYPHAEMDGVKIIKLPFPTAPFSFFRYVFVRDEMVGTPEFDHILAHERTHIQQKHSLDLIFVQLLAAFLWFNPVIWLLIKSLKTTHEYIADKKIINSGYSLVEYQTLLLKQLISNNSFGLVHNFNLSFIKKRITMMTHKKSGWSGKVKVA